MNGGAWFGHQNGLPCQDSLCEVAEFCSRRASRKRAARARSNTPNTSITTPHHRSMLDPIGVSALCTNQPYGTRSAPITRNNPPIGYRMSRFSVVVIGNLEE